MMSCDTMQVKVGTEQVINWRLGVNYNDVTIKTGMGVVFRWDDSVAHNLIEMTSRDAVTDCNFVGDNSVLLGKVELLVLELCDNKDNKIIETINFIVIKIIVFYYRDNSKFLYIPQKQIH